MNYKLKFSTRLFFCIFYICGLFFSNSAVAQHAFPTELAMPAAAQASSPIEAGETQVFALMDAGAPGGEPQSDRQPQGSISGTVVDQAGAVAVGANVRLTLKGQAQKQDVLSGDNGQFSFYDLAPGPFQITVSAPGFEAKLVSGIVNPGQAFFLPAIVLTVAATTTDVDVRLSVAEIAQEAPRGSVRADATLGSSQVRQVVSQEPASDKTLVRNYGFQCRGKIAASITLHHVTAPSDMQGFPHYLGTTVLAKEEDS